MICHCVLAGTSACNNCFNRTSSYSYTYTTHTIPSDITITQKDNPIVIIINNFTQEKKKKN